MRHPRQARAKSGEESPPRYGVEFHLDRSGQPVLHAGGEGGGESTVVDFVDFVDVVDFVDGVDFVDNVNKVNLVNTVSSRIRC